MTYVIIIIYSLWTRYRHFCPENMDGYWHFLIHILKAASDASQTPSHAYLDEMLFNKTLSMSWKYGFFKWRTSRLLPNEFDCPYYRAVSVTDKGMTFLIDITLLGRSEITLGELWWTSMQPLIYFNFIRFFFFSHQISCILSHYHVTDGLTG